MVKIRLSRHGRKKHPIYKIIAADSRSPRDGKFLEVLGKYAPIYEQDSSLKYFEINKEKLNKWIKCGAQTTTRVSKLLKKHDIVF